MDFEKLSKAEKIKFWGEVELDIKRCLSLCGELVSEEHSKEISNYLSHNELGIALESLAAMIMEYKWNISKQAKKHILKTFEKMGYEESETEFYNLFKGSTNAI